MDDLYVLRARTAGLRLAFSQLAAELECLTAELVGVESTVERNARESHLGDLEWQTVIEATRMGELIMCRDHLARIRDAVDAVLQD